MLVLQDYDKVGDGDTDSINSNVLSELKKTFLKEDGWLSPIEDMIDPIKELATEESVKELKVKEYISDKEEVDKSQEEDFGNSKYIATKTEKSPRMRSPTATMSDGGRSPSSSSKSSSSSSKASFDN
jgi:hypothetical protein